MATIFRYPLDSTGLSPNNLVVGETHELPNRTVRAFAPLYGAFYTNTVIITDVISGLILNNTQYKSVELYEFPTGRYGKEICGIILITDTNVSNEISISYQALGGDYSTNTDAILSMLDTIDLDNRPVNWPDIVGKPSGYTTAAHFHDIGDVYGFEYLVNSIERVRSAIMYGDNISHDSILHYIDQWGASLSTSTGGTSTSLTSHLQNTSNPHTTTKAQVGLGNVENYPLATIPSAQAATSNVQFMSPSLTATTINTLVPPLISAHTSRTDNPHTTTKAQVGLGNVNNYATATNADGQVGTSSILYMTPSAVAAAITTLGGVLLTTHSNRVDNPHSVTKTQIGLGNVANFAVATNAEAIAGTSSTTYMTPASTTTAITTARDSGLLDSRYIPTNMTINGSIRVSGSEVQAYIGGVWQIIWPPQWQ